MISQLFEVQIKEGQIDRYLDLAASLKPTLEAMGGCLFLDRFKSLTRENVLLSYQIWRDEGSMVAWRVDAKHHGVQETGREHVFADYRIRIAQVLHEERLEKSAWRPERLSPYNDPKRRPPTFVVASESRSRELAVETPWERDVFESVYRPGMFAHLVDVPSFDAGVGLGRKLFAEATTDYFRVLEVMRDYGMFDRGEAPQYYPPAPRCA
ncbi:MAG: antibiotic biosynthesis monooxygenase [Rhizobacter sp.]|nr:antibiotic biosynthesis monooxygenase [Rhizobacter sp.]